MTASRAELRGKTFGVDRIILDGGRFIECEFNGTTLIYCGGGIPEIDRCRLNGVNFSFEGPAKNTVELLRWLNSQRVIDGV